MRVRDFVGIRILCEQLAGNPAIHGRRNPVSRTIEFFIVCFHGNGQQKNVRAPKQRTSIFTPTRHIYANMSCIRMGVRDHGV